MNPSLPLAPEQAAACDTLFDRLTDGESREAVLTGPAGTGKTFLVRHLAARLRRERIGLRFMAPTGKAADRLHRLSGENVSTIHAALFAQVREFEVWRNGLFEERQIALPDEQDERRSSESDWEPFDYDYDTDHVYGGAAAGDNERAAPTAANERERDRYEREKAQAMADGYTFSGQILPRFDVPREPCDPDEVILVDEASMVGSELYGTLKSMLPDGARVCWIGDHAQLPPVKDTWGPDLWRPTAALTEVHRVAAASPVIQVATALRLTGRFPPPGADPRYVVERVDLAGAAQWLADLRAQNEDATLITYTNALRQALNGLVRHARGLGKKQHVTGQPFEPGDLLLVLRNQRGGGFRNGEVLPVHEVFPLRNRPYGWEIVVRDPWTQELRPRFRVNADLVGKPVDEWNTWLRQLARAERDTWLPCDYGECLTVHKAQGSEWKHLGFVWDDAIAAAFRRDPAFGRRLLYTAGTRSSEYLRLLRVAAGR